MTFLRAGAVLLQLLVNITALFFIVLPFTLTAVTGGTRRLDYVIPILIRGMDIFLCVALPTFARFMVKEDTFVMFYFSLLNVMIFTTIWVYFPVTGADRPVVIAITLLLSPAVFLYIDNLFHSLVTYSTSDHLGYYGRFHRGVQVVLEGVLKGLEGLEGLARGLEALTQLWLRALVICCGGAREEDIEIRGDFVQASPPPYFNTLATDTVVITRNEKM